MATTLSVNSTDIELDEEGYMVDADQWNEDIARAFAAELNIALTDKCWEVLNWLREQHKKNVEMSIRKVGHSGIVDIREFYELFPGAPLKNASKIAGLKKPSSCL